MSVYTYPESKLIDEVTFKKTAQGAVRAYVHARPDASPVQIQEVLKEFQSNGWQAIPFNLNGKPTLEVRGLKNEPKFIRLLEERGWATGASRYQAGKEERLNLLDKFRKRTLQASGVAMAVADTGFIIYGLKEAKLHKIIDPKHKRDFRDALAGFSYLSGSTVFSLYGRNDQSDLQVREIAGAILQHAKSKGLAVSNDSAAQSVGTPRRENVMTKLHNFFRQHPSEIGNMAYFTAGLLIASSALKNRALAKPRPEMTPKQIREMRKGGWGDTALGTSTMVSGLIATFGKEKAPDPNAPEKHGVGKWWDQFKRSPLAIAGAGYIGSTLFHAFTTHVERKEAKRMLANKSSPAKERKLAEMKLQAIPFRRLFIGATLIGEFLLTISSKGHGEGIQIDDTVDQSIYAVAADLIARQPADLRAGLIEYMAGYLSDPKVLGGNRQKIAGELRTDVECMLKNPWAQPLSAAIGKKDSAASAAWQARVAAPEASTRPQMSV